MNISPADNLPDYLCEPPGFLGNLVSHLDETAERRCPELFLAASLCALSVIVGRKTQDYRGTRPNIYTVSLASTGAGKNHSRIKLKELLLGTHLEGPSKFTSEAAIATALTVSASRLFQIDEFGDYVALACNQRASGPLKTAISGLTEIYTASGVHWSPDAHADQRNDRLIVQPNLVIHGTTNSDDLFEGLTLKQVSSGFVGRLLVFLSPGGGGKVDRKPFVMRPIPKRLIDFRDDWLNRPCGPGNISDRSPDPPVMPISDDALARINGHIDGIDEHYDEDKTAAAIWSRASEKTSKLALLSAVSRGSVCIDRQDADWSIAVTNFLTRRLIALLRGNIASTDHERKIQRVIRIVGEAGGVLSLGELARKTQWLPSRERLQIVSQLFESGMLLDVCRTTITRPARGVAISEAAIARTKWVQITASDIEAFQRSNRSKNSQSDSMSN